MILLLLVKGFLLGFAVAAPIGPIGTLCINRTMERGFWYGVSAGLGAAIGDMIFAVIAAAGFAATQHVLETISLPLKIIGGLLILIMGIRIFQARPAVAAAKVEAADLVKTTISTFLLTITNPATIFGFAVLFAGAGLADTKGVSPFFLVAGVFLGSLAWWCILCGTVNWLHRRLPDHFTVWVSRASAVFLIGFGVVTLSLAARQYWA
ncbi:LysE family translocator [Rhizobium paknamense]|uniref:LysE/RhtB family amino acid efflux pump n=1 Tax=Rhizobium paknamense TaxID=1206817 RepID=A0ABU0IF55_9HYPH|nr:LysE family transporter [Rhizobium paknamense]MDQ0456095.1 putative LysE/RhtB family amino acid efflux pump [Rhizobium paknamense]